MCKQGKRPKNKIVVARNQLKSSKTQTKQTKKDRLGKIRWQKVNTNTYVKSKHNKFQEHRQTRGSTHNKSRKKTHPTHQKITKQQLEKRPPMRKRKQICLYTPSYPLELRIRFEGERNIETQERKNNSPYKCSCHSQKEVTEATKNMSCETGGEKTKETKK